MTLWLGALAPHTHSHSFRELGGTCAWVKVLGSGGRGFKFRAMTGRVTNKKGSSYNYYFSYYTIHQQRISRDYGYIRGQEVTRIRSCPFRSSDYSRS